MHWSFACVVSLEPPTIGLKSSFFEETDSRSSLNTNKFEYKKYVIFEEDKTMHNILERVKKRFKSDILICYFKTKTRKTLTE